MGEGVVEVIVKYKKLHDQTRRKNICTLRSYEENCMRNQKEYISAED